MLHLSSGRLAIQNISFLISDDELVSTKLIIGRPILAHMGINTNTLLEKIVRDSMVLIAQKWGARLYPNREVA